MSRSKKDAQDKSTFVTRNGLWKWRVLPFGLTSPPATFERLMEKIVRGLQWKTLLLYLDNVIVYSPDSESHLTRLEEVLKRFCTAKLKLKSQNCEILHLSVKFLGHVVSAEGVKTDPDKVRAAENGRYPAVNRN